MPPPASLPVPTQPPRLPAHLVKAGTGELLLQGLRAGGRGWSHQEGPWPCPDPCPPPSPTRSRVQPYLPAGGLRDAGLEQDALRVPWISFCIRSVSWGRRGRRQQLKGALGGGSGGAGAARGSPGSVWPVCLVTCPRWCGWEVASGTWGPREMGGSCICPKSVRSMARHPPGGGERQQPQAPNWDQLAR